MTEVLGTGRYERGDCCGGFCSKCALMLYLSGRLSPQDPKNIKETPTPGSTLITPRSGVRISPAATKSRALCSPEEIRVECLAEAKALPRYQEMKRPES